MLARTLAVGLLTAVVALSPQQSALTGQVMVASGSDLRPVRRAKVTLTGRGLLAPRLIGTDVKGAYRFDRLPAGEHRIAVQKPGFVPLDAEAQPNATLTMVRGGAIEGVVADAAGDAVWNVVVTAQQPQQDGGRPQTIAQTRTDDLGRYRLHSLPAGDYYVEAATDQAFVLPLVLMPGEKRPDVNRAYYPAAATTDAARAVPVSPGRGTTAIDITLTPNAPVKDAAAGPPAARPDATGTAHIAGRVVDATSGRPVKDAQLLLLPVEGQRLTNWTRTDPQGRFEYTALQARRYTLRVQADRFVTLEFGQKRPGESGTEIQLRDGQRFTADMKLPRASAMEGVIVDEFGDPAPNVLVQAVRREYVAGRHRLMPAGGRLQRAITDDRGHYRISALPPGDYYVAGLSGAFSEMNEVGGFAPTYYPGTADAGAAVPVTLDAGVDGVAGFSLVPTATFTISGTMVDAAGKPVSGRGSLWLATPDKAQRADFNIARGSTGPDGRFVLRNVPQGSYTMQGFGPPPPDYKGPMNLGAMMFGWQPVAVGDTDVDDVLLRVTGGTSLRGRFVLEDTSTAPPRAEQLRVTAIPVEFDSAPIAGGPPPSQTRDDLTFEVRSLSGLRRVLVTVSSPEWALKKITANGIDITDSAVDLREKNVEGAEVLLTPQVSRLTGTVSDDKGSIVDYAVIVFASDPTKWLERSRFVLMARPTQQGRFTVQSLPPEEYLAIALPNVSGNEWQDPDFLHQARAQATLFTLGEGESKTLDLKLKRRP